MAITKIIHTSSYKGPYVIAGFKNPLDKVKFIDTVYQSIYFSNPYYKDKEDNLIAGFQRTVANVRKYGFFSKILDYEAYNLPGVKSFMLSPKLRFIFFDGTKSNLLLSNYHFVGIDFENQSRPFGSPKSRALFLEKVRELIEALHPAYAGGDAAKIINKTTGKDPRQYCWAYNYFSPKLLKTVKREELEKLVAQNDNWTLKELSTGGVLFQLNDPFDKQRRKEYSVFKKQAEKALNLKKLFKEKQRKQSKITRKNYGRGEETTAGYSEVFPMMFAVEKGKLKKQDYLYWLKEMDKEFKSNYHDSLLEEWAEMFANSTMEEGISLKDTIFDMKILDGSQFGESHQNQTFINVNIGLSLFDDCDCSDPDKHRKDCEQQRNIKTTLKFFSLAVENLEPEYAFLCHEAEVSSAIGNNSKLSDFLFPLTFISDSRLKGKCVKYEQLNSPIIKTKNGVVLENFSEIFAFGGEDEFYKRKKKDAELLKLQDVEELF